MSSATPAERSAIVNSLRVGVTPSLGLRHIQVGRSREIKAVIADLDAVKQDGSAVRFIVGDYGTLHHTIATAIIKILILLLGFGMGLASILTWMERRQSAMMQDRLGPNRANIGPIKAWGITHFIADALKFMFKEDFVPPKAHKFLFGLAPILAMAPALIVSAIIPFGGPLSSTQWVAAALVGLGAYLMGARRGAVARPVAAR